MTGRLFVLAFALATLSATPGQAQPAYHQSCESGDLEGVWQLISVRADEPGVEAFYKAHPVEYMRFKPDGDYIYVAMDEELPRLADVNASLDRADRADGVTYRARVEGMGDLTIYRDGQPFQRFRCVMSDRRMNWNEAPGMPELSRSHARVRD